MKSIIIAAAMLAALTSHVHAAPGKAVSIQPHSVAQKVSISDHRMRQMDTRAFFDRFDLDGDGVITRKEVKIVLSSAQRKAGQDRVSKSSPSAQFQKEPQKRDRTVAKAPHPRRTDCFPDR